MEDLSMLKHDNSLTSTKDSSTSPLIANLSLTTENLIEFYKTIAKFAFDREYRLNGTLQLLAKNFLECLTDHLHGRKEINANIKAKIILSQIELLMKVQFFEGKLNVNIVQLITDDLLNNGKRILLLFKYEDEEDFLSTLRNIYEDCQANVNN